MTLGRIPEAKVPREDELEREEKFSSGRVIIVAVDHGPNSQIAFTWALDQFVTHADTIHLLHVVPKSSGAAGGSDHSSVYNATQMLFDKLIKEAYRKFDKVRLVRLLKTGEPGKEICAEAESSKAVAIVMGCRGLSAMKSMLIGSATDYCAKNSSVPVIIVPHQYRQPPIPIEESAKEEGKVDGR